MSEPATRDTGAASLRDRIVSAAVEVHHASYRSPVQFSGAVCRLLLEVRQFLSRDDPSGGEDVQR